MSPNDAAGRELEGGSPGAWPEEWVGGPGYFLPNLAPGSGRQGGWAGSEMPSEAHGAGAEVGVGGPGNTAGRR